MSNSAVNLATQKQPRRRFLGWIGLGMVAMAWITISNNQQALLDWWSASQFQPSAEISAMQARIKATDQARRVLYASRPTLQTSEEFNKNCPRQEATSYILGCYVDKNIHVYRVSGEELDGANEVTLAHELLHAIYERLSVQEKARLGELLKSDYERLKTDELIERMAMYERTEPGEFENELHSILATEFKDLSEELEKHYRRYFYNRLAVVELYERYSQQFIIKQQQAEQLAAEIERLTAEYEVSADSFTDRSNQLSSRIKDFNWRADDGWFDSEWEFYQERSRLVREQTELESVYNQLNAQEEQINSLIEEYNQLVLAIKKLNKQFDSLAPVEEVK